MNLKKCPTCKRQFPAGLLSIGQFDLKRIFQCPICHLERRNKTHGLPADEPFTGPIAEAMYNAAKKFLKRKKQK